MPMRNMSKTDSGCGASCAATSPETIAAGVGRDGSYVVTDAPRATGRRSMGTIVQQPPGALPVVAVIPPDLRRCLLRRWCSRRRRPRPPARSPHASLKARSGRSRSPPVPSGPSGALHTGGACGAVQVPQAPRPPTAAAARPTGPSGALHTGGACGAVQAPQATWCPPIGRGVCVLPGQAYPLLTGIAAWPSGPCGAARLLMSGWACSGRRLGRLSWSGPERDIAPADRSSAWHASAVKETSPLLS